MTRYHISLEPKGDAGQATNVTFDVLMVTLVIGCERFLLTNIYRPPGIDIIAFLDELSDMESTTTRGHPLSSEIDDRLNTCLSLDPEAAGQLNTDFTMVLDYFAHPSTRPIRHSMQWKQWLSLIRMLIF